MPPFESSDELSGTRRELAEARLQLAFAGVARADRPAATYRLQFNQDFTFRDAAAIVPYLDALGVTHVYASPYLMAAPGSRHGYDVVDHGRLNPELGDEADYEAFIQALAERGMSHIVDVVPNHMGVSVNDNGWWADVLENGPSSPYANFFDIDWMPLKPDLANKVLLPVLESQFGDVLEQGKLQLTYDAGHFILCYYNRSFPIGPRSSISVLQYRLHELAEQLGPDDHDFVEFQSIITALSHLPKSMDVSPTSVEMRRREKGVIRKRLAALTQASPAVHEFIEANVRIFNGTPDDPKSFDLLDELLLDQPYRLAYWRVASDEINYRRFFDVNELAAIRMEDERVFHATHKKTFELVAQGRVTGLRIDHPDGLYHPSEYFERLQFERVRQLVQAAERDLPPDDPRRTVPDEDLLAVWREHVAKNMDSPLRRPLYVVVEKILSHGERMPQSWHVDGTTGYEFMNLVNGLFVDGTREKTFSRIYERFLGDELDYDELVYRCKRLILAVSMSSELTVLGHQLDRLSEASRASRDFTLRSLTLGLREVIACFPVYRTYIQPGRISERDRRFVDTAVTQAKRRNPAVSGSIYDFIRDVLLFRSSLPVEAAMQFVGRFQQLTGPVTAKGVEDTTFYIYQRLISLNEVGGEPSAFGVSPGAFHEANLARRAHSPYSMLSTATHDVKRSEDVRARLDVLSEIPDVWYTRAAYWSRVNKPRRRQVDGEPVPAKNDEYLLYQTLVGTWPWEKPTGEARKQYVERIQQYMLKALREAKQRSSWVSPNEAYERAVTDFVDEILAEDLTNRFLADLSHFTHLVADCGLWNSLAQTVLRITCPGVPDTYQGTELWDDSLVDPDNRRPVDYALREKLLAALPLDDSIEDDERQRVACELVAARRDGRIKLYVLARMLRLRRAEPQLFATGEYLPLLAQGRRREHVVAFLRRTEEATCIVVVPRLVAGLTGFTGVPPLGEDVWDDTMLELPNDLDGAKFTRILTGEPIETRSHDGRPVLALAELFATFPVAVLKRTM